MATETPSLTAEAVLRRAADMFAQRGYASTRMKDIADTFGVTHAALYYYFRNKEQILIQINRVAIEGLMATARAVRTSQIPVEHRFEEVVRRHIEFIVKNQALVATLFDNEYALPRAHKTRLRKWRREYTEMLVEMFVEGQRAGQLSAVVSPQLAVALTLGAGNWTYRWYRLDGPIGPDDFALQSVRFLTAGFLARDAAPFTSPGGADGQGTRDSTHSDNRDGTGQP